MTCLSFFLPLCAVFLPSWSLPQHRSFCSSSQWPQLTPPCLSWAVWARVGLLGFVMETFLLRVPFLSTEHASCLSPEAPKAGKGAAALVLQVAACLALANTTLDPLLLAGR